MSKEVKKLEVAFGTRTEQREVVCEGVVKYGNNFLIRCSLNGDWKYCSEERIQKLIAKNGSVEVVGTGYKSRDGKKALRKKEAEATK